MTPQELNTLSNKIKIYNVLNVLFWIINIVAIVVPFIHYYQVGFAFDMYFLIVTVVNIIVFWISYKIMDTLVFYRNRHRHFSEKLKTDLR
jgi:hypothetical protein